MLKKTILLMLALCLAVAPAAWAEGLTPARTPLPETMRRVVDLAGCSDVLRVMGYSVVGTTNTRSDDYDRVPSYLNGALSGAAVLGSPYQTDFDLDAIRALSPDVILIGPEQAALEPELKTIAPVFTVKKSLRSWKMDMLSLGEQLGHRAEVAQWLDDYTAKAHSLGQSIKNVRGAKTSYLALMVSAGQLYAFVDGGLGGVLYSDLGLSKPKGMSDRMGVNMTTVGFDQLSLLELDVIFILGDEEDLKPLRRSTDWLALPAVKHKNVIELPLEPYLGMGYSCIGADTLLSEISTMLSTLGKQ